MIHYVRQHTLSKILLSLYSSQGLAINMKLTLLNSSGVISNSRLITAFSTPEIDLTCIKKQDVASVRVESRRVIRFIPTGAKAGLLHHSQ